MKKETNIKYVITVKDAYKDAWYNQRNDQVECFIEEEYNEAIASFFLALVDFPDNKVSFKVRATKKESKKDS